jgi:hypothetical protein
MKEQKMIAYRHETDTTATALKLLNHYVDTIPGKLKAIPDAIFSQKPSQDKWSFKEIIGHLIDSATNNHHRFVRAQFEDHPQILYQQELWNQHSYYQDLSSDHVISFWKIYNRHIIEIISHTPAAILERECLMGDGKTYSIAWLFQDYVRHMEHHFRQIPELVVA